MYRSASEIREATDQELDRIMAEGKASAAVRNCAGIMYCSMLISSKYLDRADLLDMHIDSGAVDRALVLLQRLNMVHERVPGQWAPGPAPKRPRRRHAAPQPDPEDDIPVDVPW